MGLLLAAQNFSEFGEEFARHGPRPDGIGPFSILIVQILIIVATLLILWWMLRSHYRKSSFNKSDTPLEILNKRYAAGELTKEEYLQLKKDIGAK